MTRIENTTATTNNKVYLICICAILTFQAYGQSPSEDFNKLEPLFIAKELDKGMPYFERIFTSQDVEIKLKTDIFVQEKVIENLWIALQPSWINYLRILEPMVVELQTKKVHDARDYHCNGLFHYFLGMNGISPWESYEMAFASFDEALYKGYFISSVHYAK